MHFLATCRPGRRSTWPSWTRRRSPTASARRKTGTSSATTPPCCPAGPANEPRRGDLLLDELPAFQAERAHPRGAGGTRNHATDPPGRFSQRTHPPLLADGSASGPAVRGKGVRPTDADGHRCPVGRAVRCPPKRLSGGQRTARPTPRRSGAASFRLGGLLARRGAGGGAGGVLDQVERAVFGEDQEAVEMVAVHVGGGPGVAAVRVKGTLPCGRWRKPRRPWGSP